jgi:UDP-glucuronate 4-epimerase
LEALGGLNSLQILVTGAAGFVGSAISSELANRGVQVLGIDNFSPYYSVSLKKLRKEVLLEHPNITFRNCDLAEVDSVQELFEEFEFDTVIHLAAQAGVRASIKDWSNYSRDNLSGFANVLVQSARSGISNFLYASSSSVYGNSSKDFFSESELLNVPISFYGATKLSNEILASSISKVTEMKTRGLRFFTVYGPWGRPDMVYFRMVASAITREPFLFYGDGEVERDFTYISDVVEMTLALADELLNRPKAFSDIVNIGGGQPKSINQILRITQEVARIDIPLLRKEANESDVKRTSADFSYLNSLIHAHPSVKVESGVEKFYGWATQMEIRKSLSEWVRSVP